MCGLCGNYNGSPRDDLLGRHGVLLPSGQDFGNSWRVSDNHDDYIFSLEEISVKKLMIDGSHMALELKCSPGWRKESLLRAASRCAAPLTQSSALQLLGGSGEERPAVCSHQILPLPALPSPRPSPVPPRGLQNRHVRVSRQPVPLRGAHCVCKGVREEGCAHPKVERGDWMQACHSVQVLGRSGDQCRGLL